MTAVDAALLHSHFDLPRRRPLSRATSLAIGASVAVHLALGAYIYQAKFRQAFLTTTEEPRSTQTEIVTLPDDKPKPPPADQKPPIQVHRPPETLSFPTIETLPIPPVDQKVFERPRVLADNTIADPPL